MTAARVRKKRALEKAGLRFVAGWLPEDRARQVAEEIEAALPLVGMAQTPEGGQ